jgi:hypothetical protein
MTLSIWESAESIPRFGTTVPSHIDAARSGFAVLAFAPDRGPELWSTKWRLAAVSNNLNWGDFELNGSFQLHQPLAASLAPIGRVSDAR